MTEIKHINLTTFVDIKNLDRFTENCFYSFYKLICISNYYCCKKLYKDAILKSIVENKVV